VTGRPPAAPARLRVVAVTVLVLVAAGGCGPSAVAPSRPPGSPAGSGGAPAATTSLDRDLGDSEAYRSLRDELVDGSVAAVVKDPRVIAAMRTVPRHCFVPTGELDFAYRDVALPIGLGQTISQPSLVGMMTELLDVGPGDRVLEIGTGSGYQAAILRQLTDEVYSVEIIPELAASGRAVLDALGYGDIHTDRRDGYFGWPEHAPYDAIVVTAAPDHLPSPLVDQLSPDGGRLVIPIGPPGDVQTLWLVTRQGDDVKMEQLIAVQFVPLTREAP
jgi:protein-L-isoaspartate(D-aspartate) O-methyltransferase